MALSDLGLPFEAYRVCEFDKFAMQSYNAIHATSFVTSDIQKLTADDLGVADTDKYSYLMAIFGELFGVDWQSKVNELIRRYHDSTGNKVLHSDGIVTADQKIKENDRQ